jgi:hypothetical protein
MIKKIAVAGLVGLVELMLGVIAVRWLLAGHTSTETQLAIVAGVVIMSVFSNWQRGRTTRNADLAAAIARSAGTIVLPNVRGRAPVQIGVPLSGVQPGAVQVYPDGTPIDRPLDEIELDLAAERAVDPTPAAEPIAASYAVPARPLDPEIGTTCGECGWTDYVEYRDGSRIYTGENPAPHTDTHEAWLHARRVARGQVAG